MSFVIFHFYQNGFYSTRRSIMKKNIILFCLLSLFFAAHSSQAVIKNATITWDMSDISEVTGYKMYYSYNSDMSNKQLACMTNDRTATSLRCEGLDLQHSPVYFVIAALLPEDEASSGTASESFVTAITKVQGFQVEAPSANTPPHAVITTDTTSGQAPLTVHFDAGQSSDSDGSIVSYSWNFGDGSSSSSSVSPSHTYSATVTFQATLTVTDNEGATASAHTTITTDSASPSTYMINFQPDNVPVPAGFSLDRGLYFETERGYGWNSYLPNTRDRDNPASPDQSYDTNIVYIDNSHIWEISLPNGAYTVTICVGDPDKPLGLQSIQVEGESIINENLSNEKKWIEKTISTQVTDGRLTVSFDGSDESRLCWIKINPIGQ